MNKVLKNNKHTKRAEDKPCSHYVLSSVKWIICGFFLILPTAADNSGFSTDILNQGVLLQNMGLT